MFHWTSGAFGPGLPTARNIIEGHAGRIDVESEPGRGTKFTISLPVPARIGAPAGLASTQPNAAGDRP